MSSLGAVESFWGASMASEGSSWDLQALILDILLHFGASVFRLVFVIDVGTSLGRASVVEVK